MKYLTMGPVVMSYATKVVHLNLNVLFHIDMFSSDCEDKYFSQVDLK